MEMMLYGVVCKNRYKKAEASLALFFFFFLWIIKENI